MLNVNSPIVQQMLANTPPGQGNFNIQNPGYYSGPQPTIQNQWVPVGQAPTFNQSMGGYPVEMPYPQQFNQPMQYNQNPYMQQPPAIPAQYCVQPTQQQVFTQYGPTPIAGYAAFNNVNPNPIPAGLTQEQRKAATPKSKYTLNDLEGMSPADRMNALFEGYDNPGMPNFTPKPIDHKVETPPIGMNPYYGTGQFWFQPNMQSNGYMPSAMPNGYINPFASNSYGYGGYGYNNYYGIVIPPKYNPNSTYVQHICEQASITGLSFEDQVTNDTMLQQRLIISAGEYKGFTKEQIDEQLKNFQYNAERYLYWPQYWTMFTEEETEANNRTQEVKKPHLKVSIRRGDEVIPCKPVSYNEYETARSTYEVLRAEQNCKSNWAWYKAACEAMHFRNQSFIPEGIDMYDLFNGGYMGVIQRDQEAQRVATMRTKNIMAAYDNMRWRANLEKASEYVHYSSIGIGPFGKPIHDYEQPRQTNPNELTIPVPKGPVFKDYFTDDSITDADIHYKAVEAGTAHERAKVGFDNHASAEYSDDSITVPEYHQGMSKEEFMNAALGANTREEMLDLLVDQAKATGYIQNDLRDPFGNAPSIVHDRIANEIDMKRNEFNQRIASNQERHRTHGGTD